MFSRIAASLLACSLLISCSGKNNSGSNQSGAISADSAAKLADMMSVSIESDSQNVAGIGQGTPSGMGKIPGGALTLAWRNLAMGFQFPFFGESWGQVASASCVTVSNKSSGGNTDILLTYNCQHSSPSVAGTEEYQSSGSSSANSFKLITDITVSDDSGNSRTTNSTLAIALNSDGSWSATKQLDDDGKLDSDSYEAKGSLEESFTPDKATAHSAGGGVVQISDSVDFIDNGTDQGTYTISSSNLHRSGCGFDSGSIQFQSASTTILVSYSSCGHKTITVNGASVQAPQPPSNSNH